MPRARKPRRAGATPAGRTSPPFTNRALCVPVSATRPSSSTTIRSASRTVDRRWAMTIVVRSACSRSSARRTACSLTASRCEVASSRIRIGASFRKARAIATRWRWPPLRLVPRSPTGESRPSGRAATSSDSEACSIAASQLGFRCFGPGEQDVGAQRVVEEIGVLRDQRDHAAQLVELVVLEVGAVQRDAAGVGIPEAQQQLRRRGLAGARGADQRDGLAGRDGDGDVGQRAARLAGIGEAHAFERERGRALPDRRAGSVAHRDRLVGQRIDAPRGAQRVGELAADLGDLRHRQERRHREDGEQRQQAGIDRAPRRQHRAGRRRRRGRRGRSASPGWRAAG